MKKGRFLILLIAVACLTACHSFRADSKRLQRQVTEREAYAEQEISVLSAALQRHAPMDTIRAIAEHDPNLLFYVFSEPFL